MKKKTLRVMLLIVLSLVLTGTGFCADFNTSRLIPSGKVFVYENNQKIAEYTSEVPFPDGAVLLSKGRSGIQLDDIYFVADDGAEFSIETRSDYRIVNLKNGVMHFAISDLPKTIAFVTPQGVVTSKQLLLNVSLENNMLEGYVSVAPESSEIGVVRGGSLTLSTLDGDKIIRSGSRFLLAQADMGAGSEGIDDTDATKKDEDDDDDRGGILPNLTSGQILPHVAFGAVIGGMAYMMERNNDDRDGSPSRP